MLKESQYAKGALQSSASSSELPEPYTVSLPTQGPAGDSLSAAGHLGLTVSPSQLAPFSHSDEGYVDPYFSGQGTLKLSKSAQGTLGSLLSTQCTAGHFISSQGTAGQFTSAKQTTGPLTSTTEPLGSTYNS